MLDLKLSEYADRSSMKAGTYNIGEKDCCHLSHFGHLPHRKQEKFNVMDVMYSFQQQYGV